MNAPTMDRNGYWSRRRSDGGCRCAPFTGRICRQFGVEGWFLDTRASPQTATGRLWAERNLKESTERKQTCRSVISRDTASYRSIQNFACTMSPLATVEI